MGIRELSTLVMVVTVASLSSHCNNFISKQTDSVYMDYGYEQLGYKLFEPSSKYFLSYDLEEISALSYYKDGMLVAVEDEDGKLYFLNGLNGKIERSVSFGEPGDYEGVEIVGDQVYILRSDGDLFTFSISTEDKVEPIKIETPLSRSNDVEGLGYSDGRLLLACKGSGDTDDNHVKGKAIYSFDIAKEKLMEKELFFIAEDDLNDFIKSRKYFQKVNDFDPSAIAKHPTTGDVYVLSADKCLVVLDKNFDLIEVIRLNSVVYNQAEGICFAPDGTLYISSEGDGGRGKIMKLNYAK